MLILLPPSEGKAPDGAAGRRRRPLDLARLSFPELTEARARVLDGLTRLCADPAAAAGALRLGPTQRDEIVRNTVLRTAPALPAAEIYTGVLYEALDVATLGPDARRFVDRTVVIFSGLWGAVRLADRIPPYRCSVGVSLPDLGGLASWWRRHLSGALTVAARGRLVMDLRSGGYAPMWSPAGEVAAVRVLHERFVDGVATRTVVSHFNKATKGRLVRDLATRAATVETAGELVTALRDLKYTVDAAASADGLRHRLDVVVSDL